MSEGLSSDGLGLSREGHPMEKEGRGKERAVEHVQEEGQGVQRAKLQAENDIKAEERKDRRGVSEHRIESIYRPRDKKVGHA